MWDGGDEGQLEVERKELHDASSSTVVRSIAQGERGDCYPLSNVSGPSVQIVVVVWGKWGRGKQVCKGGRGK